MVQFVPQSYILHKKHVHFTNILLTFCTNGGCPEVTHSQNTGKLQEVDMQVIALTHPTVNIPSQTNNHINTHSNLPCYKTPNLNTC